MDTLILITKYANCLTLLLPSTAVVFFAIKERDAILKGPDDE